MLVDNKIPYDEETWPSIKSVVDIFRKLTGRDSNRAGSLDIVSGFFSIAGLNILKNKFSPNNSYRLILSELAGESGKTSRIIDLLHGDSGIDHTLKLKQEALDAIEFLRRPTVQIRAITTAFCHAKAYIYKDADPCNNYYVMGSSNLTEAGLGMHESSNVELNLFETGANNEWKQLCKWFDFQWKNDIAQEKVHENLDDPSSPLIPVKDYFIKRIQESFCATRTPEEIYYKILFELFRGEIDLDSSIEEQKELILFQDSTIYKTLYDYQQKGVISLIKMLRKWNGAILADAVGLGKTFSALAVMKYFQNNGYTVLMLCPKKLEQNWKQYLRKHDSRFERDEFDYIVRFHTDLQDDRMSKGHEAPLSWLLKKQKLLVVIDESHNLRNDKSSRYKMLLNDIIADSATPGLVRDVKVLLLSATPINNQLNDLRNQYKLIARGKDDAFNQPGLDIPDLTQLFADANKDYQRWIADKSERLSDLIKRLPHNFFELTDKLIVARTRAMIEHTFHDTQTGFKFPTQLKPINHFVGLKNIGTYNSIADIYTALKALNLTAYKPSFYLDKPGTPHAKNWQDNTFRENYLVRMMAILFMKRLESSWTSCLQTLEKVKAVHEQTLDKVNAFLAHRDAPASLSVDDLSDEDKDELDEDLENENDFSLRNNTIQLKDMHRIDAFKKDLEDDIERLRKCCDNFHAFREQLAAGNTEDKKLSALLADLADKQTKPNKKVVVFTSFGDTANYLYAAIRRAHPSWRVALITGQTKDAATPCPNAPGHDAFQTILQRFAPYSKLYLERDCTDLYPKEERDTLGKKCRANYSNWRKRIAHSPTSQTYKTILDNEIDILIATDCLSEGQNLQDADTVINYDIHWNPVRLVQRFGRIDRLGSPNDQIQAVNFWPAEDLNGYLKLKELVDRRMVTMALTGAETQPTEDKIAAELKNNEIIQRNTNKLLKQMAEEKISDIEQSATDADPDAASATLGLADFTLETFRQDLVAYLEKNRDFFLKMPSGVFSGWRSNPDLFRKNPPESLVALLGYPRRTPENPTRPYDKFYLLLQPINANANPKWLDISTSSILTILRNNKSAQTFLPHDLEVPNEAAINRLKAILQNWMTVKTPIAIDNAINDFFSNKQKPKSDSSQPHVEDIFKPENFDLIAWEYISNSDK